MALSKIKGTVIADDAINADRIADGTVVASDLLDNTITGAKLATDIAISTTGATVLNGTIKLDGNYPVGIQNVALGDGALGSASFSGDYNTAIGHTTLSSNTSGDRNTGVGRQVLCTNTTGGCNTAIGFFALAKNTTGLNNTASGYLSLDANTFGDNNTALGSNALTNSTTASNNTAVGYASLCSNTTGNLNTAVGYLSLCSNTTGTENTALGRNALGSNTTANNNTAVGARALSSNTTGHSNNALGEESLLDNTTGCFNTAIGRESLWDNTTGGWTVAVGHQALLSQTTGNFNVAVGSGSLCANTTASSNTAVGYLSLNANTTATFNTAVGMNALCDATTGGCNTAVGHESLLRASNGNSNTAVGRHSMCNLTSGADNTALGRLAGSNITSGSNLTVIGYSAQASSATATNEITLGDANVTDLRVPGAGFYIDDGNVGIGISSPDNKLHVQNGDASASSNSFANLTVESNSSINVLQFLSPNTAQQQIRFGDPQDDGAGFINYSHASSFLSIAVNGPEKMRINSSGNVLVNATSGIFSSKLEIAGSSATVMQGFNHTSTTSGTHVFQMETGRLGGGIGTGNFIRLTDGGNLRFQFKGDGNATCDGSFSGGGADYAEYFEWVDGNPSNEDRIGLSVVLDNGKIREATASDTNIIGVVSANPTVVGDEQPNSWQGKFVRDDYNRVQYETLTSYRWTEINEDGSKEAKGCVPSRDGITPPNESDENIENLEEYSHDYPIYNSDFDNTQNYIPRSQRQEWSAVGLMGKLRIKKGQQTSSNWIKIKDISDTVEEWLIK